MSPEQLRGARDLDGRSDVYGLGCVLYEMLTGAPPAEPGAPVGGALAGTPLERAVARAIAPARADRFQSAGELARALEEAATGPALVAPGVATPAGGVRGGSRRLGMFGGAALALAAAAAAVVARGGLGGGSLAADAALDPRTVAVLPFRHDAASAVPAAVLTGDNCARLLYDALARWQSLRLSDEMRVADAVRGAAPNGPAPVDTLSVDGARDLARRLGAGRFVWGAVSSVGGALRVSARLYDTRDAGRAAGRDTAPAAHVVTVAAGGDVVSAFEQLADALVAKLAGAPDGAAPGAGSGAGGGTRNFDALKHYADGYAALHTWDTPEAERHFRAAVGLDSAFAQASLALAQSMAWSGRYRPPAWRDPAGRAVADSARLAPRDRALAGALLAIAESRQPAACAIYRALLARAPDDFAAQLGLGECLSTDARVVRDPADPRRWRFRASRAQAVAAYTRALAMVPSYFEAARGGAFDALTRRVLMTNVGGFRRGFALPPDTAAGAAGRDTVWLGAYPELAGDTVTYRPVPIAELFRGSAPPSHRAALARDRETLRALTARWTQAHPRSATAWRRHAEALEVAGMLDAPAPGVPGALYAAQRARALVAADRAPSAAAIADAAATETRVLLKLGWYDKARAVAVATLADSGRTAATIEEGKAAEVLAALAALTGRARLAARLLERATADTSTELFLPPSRGGPTPPAPVLRAAGAYAAYAALAAPEDMLRAARARVERAVDDWAPATREQVRGLVLARSSMLAQPVLGTAALRGLRELEPYDDLLPLWQALDRGDAAAVRAGLAAAPRTPVRSGARVPEWLLQRAHLALAVRDTATAVALLDEILATLPNQPARLTREPPAAAALGRALVLRARLPGAGARDAGRGAAALWSDADPELRAELRGIAGAPPARDR